MKQKIIYIAGLGHSGTTILDMALSANSEVTGLGEVKATLEQDFDKIIQKKIVHVCSCGKTITECDFWNCFMHQKVDSKLPIEVKYKKLLEYAKNEKGIQTILDSSKNSYGYLKYLKDNYDLRVIFITRDFRSWIYSRFSRSKKSMILLGYRWWLENIKIRMRIMKMDIPIITIGYEELCMFPELILKSICSFTGIQYSPAMLSPDKTASHIVLGNIARIDKEKRKSIVYDMRWMTSIRLNLLLPLFLPLMKWNKKTVYSNVMLQKTKAFNKKQRDFYLFGDKNKEMLIHEFEKSKLKASNE